MCNCLTLSTIIDYLLKSVTLILAGLTVYKAFIELQENRAQRVKELRLKQAEEAKKLIDQCMGDKEAYDALRMIEYENRTFKDENGEPFSVNYDLIIKSLSTESKEFDLRSIYIRDTFDSLLYYTELMQQGINSGLYTLENLKFPLGYYLGAIVKYGLQPAVKKYMTEAEFKGSLKLFNQFDIWVTS